MISTLTQMKNLSLQISARWIIPTALIGTLAACGGEGAGDEPIDTTALLPFVGTYNLVGSWNGVEDDEALMVIRAPDSNGESEVVIYDFLNNAGDCYDELRPGEAKIDIFTGNIFLDKIIQFDEAVLSLSGTTLVIEYVDSFDGNSNGNLTEELIYRAPSVGQLEQDISPTC